MNQANIYFNESTQQLHVPFNEVSRPPRRGSTGHCPPHHEYWTCPNLQRRKQSRQSFSYNRSCPFTRLIHSYHTSQSPQRYEATRKDGSGCRYRQHRLVFRRCLSRRGWSRQRGRWCRRQISVPQVCRSRQGQGQQDEGFLQFPDCIQLPGYGLLFFRVR